MFTCIMDDDCTQPVDDGGKGMSQADLIHMEDGDVVCKKCLKSYLLSEGLDQHYLEEEEEFYLAKLD